MPAARSARRSPLLRGGRRPRHGSAFMPADEALAQVALEASETAARRQQRRPHEARAGGLGSDLAARFLEAFAEAAGLTLHVRLIDGEDSRHVLEAIFKALGAALSQAPAARERRNNGREGDRPHRGCARAVPGRALRPGDQGGRPRLRRRPARLKPGGRS